MRPQVWDDDTNMFVRSVLPPGEWTGAILSDDGSLLATTKVNLAQIWDRTTGNQIGNSRRKVAARLRS